MNKYPDTLNKILKEAPVAFGIVAILDFRKGKPISTIQKEWDLLKAKNAAKDDEMGYLNDWLIDEESGWDSHAG